MTTPAPPSFRTIFHLLIFIACMLAPSLPLHAQIPSLDDAGGGTRYLLAFPDTVGNLLDPRYPNTRVPCRFSICIYSGVAGNPVRITRGDGSQRTLVPVPGRFLVVPVSPDPAVTRVGAVNDNTIAVESVYPVVVYCFTITTQGMDAWTPLPVDRWGRTYTVAALAGDRVTDVGTSTPQGTSSTGKPAPGEAVVIGGYDNTHVSIVAGAQQRLIGGAASMNVTLRAGECFQVQSVVDTTPAFDGDQVDIAGMQVKADRPVGVISGNTRSLVRPNGEGLLMNAYKNMGMEWLAPADEHGREFVYMPSWDIHRPGINAPAERAGEIVRIYGTTAPSTSFTALPAGLINAGKPVAKDTVRQIDLSAAQAVGFRTSAPAQAYMHSASIVQLIARTPYFNRVMETYAGWAPYMVELVPREQWTSFAPYYTPDIPTGMLHYINVVADTMSAPNVVNEYGERFPFQWRIAGTDLIWGTMLLDAGETHHLLGLDGARFGGFVYGFYQGGEDFVPATKTRKREGNVLAMGGVIFQEYSALSYAYPLVALRNALTPPDDYHLTSSAECGRTIVTIHAASAAPAGIRSIALDPARSGNSRIVPITPQSLADANGLAQAELALAPVDPLADAHGRLVVRDRTGGLWSMDYTYQAARLDLSADSLDLGERSINLPADTVISITNPLDADVTVDAVSLGASNGFTIVGTTPDGPAATTPRPVTLRRGETLAVRLRLSAPAPGEYHASLAVAFGCAGAIRRIPLRASVAEPLIMVPDLSFGTLRKGSAAKTLELSICNVGRGHLGFGPPNADSVLDLRGEGFTVAAAELERLKAASIGPGECFVLHVSFAPLKAGVYTARARFLDNARRLRDSSIWSAVVVDSGSLEVDERARGYMLGEVRPNPSGGHMTIGYALGRAGLTVMTIHDNAGRMIATLVEGAMSAGEHHAEWEATGLPAGVYYCRITSGGWSGVRPIVLVR